MDGAESERRVTSPKVQRAIRKDVFAAALDRSIRAHEIRRDVLASDLGVCPSKLVAWTTPGTGQSIPAADIAALPPAVARDVLRSIADALGLGVVELPAASRSSAALAAARLARESGEVIADAYEAHADGVVTPAEGARLERQCDDALAALLEVREHAREAQKVPVRRIGEARRA